MPVKPPVKRKPKLTDAERHKRFVDTAREIGTDEGPEAFEKALHKVASKRRVIRGR